MTTRNFFTGLLLTVAVSVGAQQLSTKTGKVDFDSSMPAFEEVAAKNKTASALIDLSNGNIAAVVPISGFKFKVGLMEEHFNENYMESKKFPKATFKGKIQDYDKSKLSASPMDIKMEGDLTIHGITKKAWIPAKISMQNGKVRLTSDFKIRTTDFNIDIPSVVKTKVADIVAVSLDLTLE